MHTPLIDLSFLEDTETPPAAVPTSTSPSPVFLANIPVVTAFASSAIGGAHATLQPGLRLVSTYGEPWEPYVALSLVDAANGLCARLGVDGRHPMVADAAAMVTGALATRDMETLRFAITEFEMAIRQFANFPQIHEHDLQRGATVSGFHRRAVVRDGWPNAGEVAGLKSRSEAMKEVK